MELSKTNPVLVTNFVSWSFGTKTVKIRHNLFLESITKAPLLDIHILAASDVISKILESAKTITRYESTQGPSQSYSHIGGTIHSS